MAAEAKVQDEEKATEGPILTVTKGEKIALAQDSKENYTVMFPTSNHLAMELKGYGPVIAEGTDTLYGASVGDVVISINGVPVNKVEDMASLDKVKQDARVPLSVLIRSPPKELDPKTEQWAPFKITDKGPVPLKEYMQANRQEILHGEKWDTTDPYNRVAQITRAQKENLAVSRKVVGISDLSKLDKGFLADGETIVGAIQGVACQVYDPKTGLKDRKAPQVGNCSLLIVRSPLNPNHLNQEGTNGNNRPAVNHRLLVYREENCEMGYKVEEHFVQQNADLYAKETEGAEEKSTEYPEFESMTKIGKYEATRSRDYNFQGYFLERQLINVSFAGRAKVLALIQRTEKHFQAEPKDAGQGNGCCACCSCFFSCCSPKEEKKQDQGGCCSCFCAPKAEKAKGTEFKGMHYNVEGHQAEHDLEQVLNNKDEEQLSEIEKVVRSTNVENVITLQMKDLWGDKLQVIELFINPLTPPTAPLCFVSMMHNILGNSVYHNTAKDDLPWNVKKTEIQDTAYVSTEDKAEEASTAGGVDKMAMGIAALKGAMFVANMFGGD